MFHNSTTLYRFSKQSIRLGQERRVVYGIMSSLSNLKTGTLSAWDTTKKVLWRSSNLMFLGAPYLIKRSKKAIKEKITLGAVKGEETLRTGWEGGMAVKDMTLGPIATWGVEAPLTDLKMSLVDVPIAAAGTAFGTPIDVVKEFNPRTIIENTRDSIKGIVGGIGDTVKNFFTVQPREFFKSIGSTFKNTLLPPWLTRPIANITKRTRNLVSKVIGSKTQYLEKVFVTAPQRVKAGWERLKNARATAIQNTREAIAKRALKKEELEMEEQQELQKKMEKDGTKPPSKNLGR